MLLNKKQLSSFCVVILFVLSIIVVKIVLQKPSTSAPESLEKIGIISSVHYSCSPVPISAPGVPAFQGSVFVTCIEFEDDEVLIFVSNFTAFEVGRTYRIVYHEHTYCQQWSEKYYTIESIQEQEQRMP